MHVFGFSSAYFFFAFFLFQYQPKSNFQTKQCEELENAINFKKSEGPCVKAMDDALKARNVERQVYHGKSFVGNHVHKMLQVRLFNIFLFYFQFQQYLSKENIYLIKRINFCED